MMPVKEFISSRMLVQPDIMNEDTKIGGIPLKIIIFIVGIAITVLGGYLLGDVISHILKSYEAELIAGLILLVAGIIILSIMITRWIRR